MSTNAKDVFQSLAAVIDKLPRRVPNDTPLSEAIPGSWPTVGDLRKLCQELKTEDRANGQR